MAHFAKVINNIVTEVIVAEQAFINSGSVGDSFLWVQTSYNNSFKKNFAGIGYTYDPTRDAFIPPQPYNSWTLNEDTCLWEAPVAYPTISVDEYGNPTTYYKWDEPTTSWILVPEQGE